MVGDNGPCPVGGPLAEAAVVVVGSGVVGTSIAYRLAQSGARVTVIDPAAPGTASDVSFAWINAYDKYPRDYWALNASGIAEYRQLQAECGGSWLHTSGSLRWAPNGSGPEAAQLTATVRTMRRWGGLVEELPRRAVAGLEPGLTLPPEVDVVYRFPADGWVDTSGMRASVRAAAETRFGAVFVQDTVTGFELVDGSVTEVALRSGRSCGADVVIAATGPSTGELARLAGGTIPVGGHTSPLLIAAPLPVPIRHILASESLWIRPDPSGGLVIGSSLLPQRASQVAADGQLVRTVLAMVAELIPAAAGVEVVDIVEGTQPVPGDNFPIVGFDDRVPNLYYAVTRSGISLGPKLARYVPGDLLEEGQAALERFRPARFTAGSTAIGPPGEQ